LLKNKKRRAV